MIVNFWKTIIGNYVVISHKLTGWWWSTKETVSAQEQRNPFDQHANTNTKRETTNTKEANTHTKRAIEYKETKWKYEYTKCKQNAPNTNIEKTYTETNKANTNTKKANTNTNKITNYYSQDGAPCKSIVDSPCLPIQHKPGGNPF